MDPLQIALIGPGSCSPEEAESAERAGRCIAREGAVLICGGLSGVMEAACRGSRAESGTTVGIIPGLSGENPFLSVTIRSGLGHARNAVIIQSSDAVVAIGGSYGTLSEIALALKSGKTVAGHYTWEIPGVSRCNTPEEAVREACSAAARYRKNHTRQAAEGSP
jgi:hypothetical protein